MVNCQSRCILEHLWLGGRAYTLHTEGLRFSPCHLHVGLEKKSALNPREVLPVSVENTRAAKIKDPIHFTADL